MQELPAGHSRHPRWLAKGWYWPGAMQVVLAVEAARQALPAGHGLQFLRERGSRDIHPASVGVEGAGGTGHNNCRRGAIVPSRTGAVRDAACRTILGLRTGSLGRTPRIRTEVPNPAERALCSRFKPSSLPEGPSRTRGRAGRLLRTIIRYSAR